MIAAVEVDALSVRPELHRMRPVLAAAGGFAEKHRRFEIVAAVLFPEAKQAGLQVLRLGRGVLIYHHVERIVRVEQTVRAADLHIELLDLRLFAEANRRRREPV